ncbi:DNA dC-_dU-editing enzyme APOBEC-3H-like isoform X2 [Choloepus didactylus]|nr:DNA dC->dU-editing enzyme APOBEC-3H-like isoform X2 [Choloepus didactylus]
MKLLTVEEFNTHFCSRYTHEQTNTYLCSRVESKDRHRSRVFQCKDALHAEEHFLYWFHQMPSGKCYEITWYISWSPCSKCASLVAQFLKQNPQVSLSLLAARIYYDQVPENQEGLRLLSAAGAQLHIMSREGFKNCWENFVDKGKKEFDQWDEQDENESQRLHKRLKEILRNPMSLLKEDVFYYQFNNCHKAPKPYRRRRTYVCYQLQWHDGSIDRGYLQNKKGHHAEIRLINKIKSMEQKLDRNQSCQITCYVTWSPCFNCAEELEAFIGDNPHLSLQLCTSRLYFHWKPDFQRALWLLQKPRISVTVMSSQDFANCWRNFADHQGKPFQPWKTLGLLNESINRRLGRILTKLDGLNDAFRNLQLGFP